MLKNLPHEKKQPASPCARCRRLVLKAMGLEASLMSGKARGWRVFVGEKRGV